MLKIYFQLSFLLCALVTTTAQADHVSTIRLFSEPRLSQEVGALVTFTPILSSTDNLEFQYRVRSPNDSTAVIKRDWGEVNWIWDTTGYEAGIYTIQLRARHIGNITPYDVIAYKSFELTPLKRPNIVLIVADDLGWGDLKSYGNKLVYTPSLDELAREGVQFSQFYVNSPVCSPSRAAILTGRFPSELGIHHVFTNHTKNQQRGIVDFLDPDLPNIANTLRNTGYTTVHLGKWHLTTGGTLPIPAPAVEDYGFDIVKKGTSMIDTTDEFYRAKLPDVLVDNAIEFVDNHTISTPSTPFFLNLWFFVPHAPLTPTPEQLAVYDKLATQGAPFTSAQQIYYAAVTAMDTAIGRLLDHLDTLGIADNTVIIFTSDNGPEGIYAANARSSGVGHPGPFRGKKRSLYEGGIRTPLIVRYTNKVTPNRIDRSSVVSGVDILPTILDMTGIAQPQGVEIDGESFMDILLGASRPRTKSLMWEWRFGDLDNTGAPQINKSPIVAVRADSLKLLFNPAGLFCDSLPVKERTELYNIDLDPMEVQNIASEDPNSMSLLLGEAIAWWSLLPLGPCDRFAGQIHYQWP